MNILENPKGTLVYDIGSSSIKFGFAGDAQPLFSVPSSAAKIGESEYQFGDEWMNKDYPGLEIIQIIADNGFIGPYDQDIFSTFFDWTYSSQCMNIEPQEHPILVSQPSSLQRNSDQFDRWRKTICSVLFEFSNHPRVCFEYDSSLASYSHGVPTSLVVDFGWSCIRVIPIIEGRPHLSAIKTSPFGGFCLCDHLETRLSKFGIDIPVKFPSKRGPFYNQSPITESQKKYCKRLVLKDVIWNNLCFIPPKVIDPNGFLYFFNGISDPFDVQEPMKQLGSLLFNAQHTTQGLIQSLPDIVNEVINNTPADVRRTLWSNIILSGGSSNLRGFGDLLSNELNTRKPKNYTVSILKPAHQITSGSFAVWSGGSILGSLEEFEDLCISKSEWEEHGENILKTKCK